jgi:hypothetical protein
MSISGWLATLQYRRLREDDDGALKKKVDEAKVARL